MTYPVMVTLITKVMLLNQKILEMEIVNISMIFY